MHSANSGLSSSEQFLPMLISRLRFEVDPVANSNPKPFHQQTYFADSQERVFLFIVK